MSEHSNDFIKYLSELARRDHGALATLRRSLSFAPGVFAPAYPHVERFVGRNCHPDDPFRQALYLTAGLFAQHPRHATQVSFASAFGTLARQRDSASLEQRFVALLGCEPHSLPHMLRQAVALLAADDLAFDYAALLDHLGRWLNPFGDEARDQLRQQWARDFYRAYDRQTAADSAAETSPSTQTE